MVDTLFYESTKGELPYNLDMLKIQYVTDKGKTRENPLYLAKTKWIYNQLVSSNFSKQFGKHGIVLSLIKNKDKFMKCLKNYFDITITHIISLIITIIIIVIVISFCCSKLLYG